MTTNNPPSSSESNDSAKKAGRNIEDKLMVAVRIRPLKPDESQRVLYAVNKKVNQSNTFLPLSNILISSLSLI